MNKFHEALSQIYEQCRGADFQAGIEQLRDIFLGKKIVLYGAGDLGTRTAKWLLRNGIHPDCFCDRAKRGIHINTGLPIVSPGDLLCNDKEANILICSIGHADSIRRDLSEMGIPEERIYNTEGLPIHEMTMEDFLQYADGYEWAYHFFTDEESKAILLNRIRGYLLSSPMKASCGIEYFDSGVMNMSREEVFVDGGMFDGDTAAEFFRCVEGEFSHYYGFEIDRKNYMQAVENLKEKNRVTLVHQGLWSREAELRIDGNLSASSKLSESGSEMARVTSIDAFFVERDDKPTLIKLDIEGAEKEALLGARNTIRLVKPTLAICAYHKPQDIYELPKLLKGYEAGYHFTLRHYSSTLMDTVLYAVI